MKFDATKDKYRDIRADDLMTCIENLKEDYMKELFSVEDDKLANKIRYQIMALERVLDFPTIIRSINKDE